MITIVAINSVKDGTQGYFVNMRTGFDYNNDLKFLQILNIKELKSDPAKTIIFHSKNDKLNPPWLKIEDFKDFNFPQEDFYYVFGSDSGNIIADIRDKAKRYKMSRFVSLPIPPKFKVLYSHCTCLIVLWEMTKQIRNNLNTLK